MILISSFVPVTPSLSQIIRHSIGFFPILNIFKKGGGRWITIYGCQRVFCLKLKTAKVFQKQRGVIVFQWRFRTFPLILLHWWPFSYSRYSLSLFFPELHGFCLFIRYFFIRFIAETLVIYRTIYTPEQ